MHLKRSLRKDEGIVGRGGGVGVGVGGGGVGGGVGGGGEQIATGVSKNLSCRLYFKHCVSFKIIVPNPHHL